MIIHITMCVHITIEPIRSRVLSIVNVEGVHVKHYLHRRIILELHAGYLYLQPRPAIIRINHRLEYFHLFLSNFFQSWRLMIASARKRAPVFLPLRAEIARCSRERNYSRVTRLFTIHINRVGPRTWLPRCVITVGRAQPGLKRAS